MPLSISIDEIQADINLLEELAAREDRPTPKRPKGFGVTISEFQEFIHASYAQARGYLNGLVEEGLLDTHRMTQGGGTSVWVYSKKGEQNART
jgi:hypothetical protein